jgi:hypothetical protein
MLPLTCAWLRLAESCWFQSSFSLARVATMLLFKWRSSTRLSQVASRSIICVSKEELTERINKLKQEHDSAQNVTVNYKTLYDTKLEEFIEVEKQLEYVQSCLKGYQDKLNVTEKEAGEQRDELSENLAIARKEAKAFRNSTSGPVENRTKSQELEDDINGPYGYRARLSKAENIINGPGGWVARLEASEKRKRESLRIEHSVKLAAAREEAAALQGKIEASEEEIKVLKAKIEGPNNHAARLRHIGRVCAGSDEALQDH